MERTGKIIRISIYAFLKDFQYFTTTPVLLMLPFSASVLLSQAFFPSSSSPSFLIIHEPLFHSAGFPSPSLLVSLFNLQKISQIIFTYVFTLPFVLSFLVIGKASLFQALNHHKPYGKRVRYDTDTLLFSSFISLYKPLLITHLWNLILNTTINMAAFNTIKAFRFFYKNNLVFLVIIEAVFFPLITNIVVVCNLALVVLGMGNCTGYLAALREAFSVRRGTTLLLALPANFGLAAVEALFYYRVVRAYRIHGRPSVCLGLEGLFIAYLHSLFIVLDTIAWCLFFKSCRSNCWTDQADYDVIELGKEELRALEELP